MGRSSGSNQRRRKQVSVKKVFLIGALGGALAAAIAMFVIYSLGGDRSATHLTEEQEYGRSLYNTNCATCHEENQLGLKKVPPNLHGVFSRSHLPSGSQATDAEVKNVILKGKNTMPTFDQRLNETEVAAIISYLHAGIR
jgi:mono/diheme cytochrome c family protein